MDEAIRKRIQDEVLHELQAGISPNRNIIRAIQLTIDKVLEMEERP